MSLPLDSGVDLTLTTPTEPQTRGAEFLEVPRQRRMRLWRQSGEDSADNPYLTPVPPVDLDVLLLEDGTGGLLLEDGSGLLALES